MKNIHVLPINKPGRLYYSGNNNDLLLSKQPISFITFERSTQNIHITSNEKIKDRDYVLSDTSVGLLYLDGEINTASMLAEGQWKKVVLTTDKDLIKDGVQAIDDDFLEWFVKNSSCEVVEVIKQELNTDYRSDWKQKFYYKIIIPKEEPRQIDEKENPLTFWGGLEEPKQETLEEVASILAIKSVKEYMKIFPDCNNTFDYRKGFEEGFVQHSKLAQKRMYSEEDMQEYAEFCIRCYEKKLLCIIAKDWFEKIKKK